MDRQDTVFKRFQSAARDYPENAMVMSKNGGSEFTSYNYKQCYEIIEQVGTGLKELGVERGDHVGIISDNRREWIFSDLGILGLGAIDVPRGSDSTDAEITYILKHADCKLSFAENTLQANKIITSIKNLPLMKTIIVYDEIDEDVLKEHSIQILQFSKLLEMGKKKLEKEPAFFDDEAAIGKADDVATIIYTSGTTGEPKGVVLTNRSFIFQLERIYEHIPIEPGETFISVLPTWHSFERAVEYIVLNVAATLAYSKPIGAVMIPDMAVLRPHWMVSVPRIWESVRGATLRNASQSGGAKKALFFFFLMIGESHATFINMLRGLLPQFSQRSRLLDVIASIIPLVILTPFKLLGDVLVFSKLKKKLGGRFRAGISGGGALPPYVDHFFQAAGIRLLEGYGLTETAPIVSVRKFHAPVPGTIGPLLKDIEWRIIGKDGNLMPHGKMGLLYLKSPQIMEGYYKRDEASAEVLKDGWLNTGDLAISTLDGELKIVGRSKETIVLLGGENIEPVPIEEKIVQSEMIDQVMVVGQDQKYLGALIVPNLERLEDFAKAKNISYIDGEELLVLPEVQEQFHDEIQNLIHPKTGFKAFERIFRFVLLPKPFEVGKELTHTMKLRRNIVNDLYKKEIRQIFERG